MNNPELARFIGSTRLTVAEAMRAIDANTCGILFLTDEGGRLCGCVTDGDIRRYLLAGGSMTGPAIDAANRHPKVAKTDAEAAALYHKKNYVVIPITDEEGRVTGVYTGIGPAVRSRAELDIPVVINAGGKGSRLDPFTRVLPKPLIPVGERPILEHILEEYRSWGCSDFRVIVNYKRELIKAYFADSEHDYAITWVDEETPLGTGGGLTLLRDRIRGTFFFAACDTLLTANYERMLQFHRENGNAVTMACAVKNLRLPYGVVEMGKNGAIERMEEKPVMSFLTNTGVYLAEPDVFSVMNDGEAVGFPEVVERLRQQGKK